MLDSPETLKLIATSIDLAVVPTFLLVGTGTFLNVATARLGRIVDRARKVEALLSSPDEVDRDKLKSELKALGGRLRCGNRAVLFFSLSAVLVCLVIGLLFLGQLHNLHLAIPIALVFVLAVSMLAIGLIFFLLEVTISIRVLRVNSELLVSQMLYDD